MFKRYFALRNLSGYVSACGHAAALLRSHSICEEGLHKSKTCRAELRMSRNTIWGKKNREGRYGIVMTKLKVKKKNEIMKQRLLLTVRREGWGKMRTLEAMNERKILISSEAASLGFSPQSSK